MKRNKGIAKAVIKRDNKKCVKCFSTVSLHAHHIVALKDGGDDTMENMTTLCSKCHNEWHHQGEFLVAWDDWINLPPMRFIMMFFADERFEFKTISDVYSLWLISALFPANDKSEGISVRPAFECGVSMLQQVYPEPLSPFGEDD